MLIDEEARKGWKILAHHVNLMDKALKRHIILDGLSDKEKQLLKKVLVEHNAEWYERSHELKSSWKADNGKGSPPFQLPDSQLIKRVLL